MEEQEKELLIQKIVSKNPIVGWDRDDLAQELRYVFARCEANFDPSKGVKFTTYFIGAAKNKLGKIRKKVYDTPLLLDDDTVDLIESPSPDPRIHDVMDALDQVTSKDIILEYYLGNLSLKEIADAHGLSIQRVHQIIQKGIEDVRVKLTVKG